MNTIYEAPLSSDNDKPNCSTHTTDTSSTVSSSTYEEHSTNSSINGIASQPSDLKILEHFKNIEKINATRRLFLSNTLSEYSKDEHTEHKQTVNGKDQIVSEEHSSVRHSEKINGVANGNDERTTTATGTSTVSTNRYSLPLKSPVSPPPKPPMLSRVRSIGSADVNQSTFEKTQNSLGSPVATTTPTITTTTVTAKVTPEPATPTIIEIPVENSSQPRKSERPISLSVTPDSGKQMISANHYERLIEELKCPGCANPMRAPILLCQTGHSVCEQCTRVLMLCPLCKEPFTSMRSLTIEALCSKAHFRCQNHTGGCKVRLQIDLLNWHERQCIYKPMKCFMGRVWGDCQWNGREAFWKEHLEIDHANKMFKTDTVDLIWNMSLKQRPLTGYYVFEVFDEMFNFYEVYDKERILFTMTCTSTIKEKKHNYAYEVTMLCEDNEALAITQKFPVHSEYDKDILLDGTCVSVSLSDLAKFIGEDKLLHYRVRIMQVKSPRKPKVHRKSEGEQSGMHPIDFQQTQIEGVNLKNVPSDVIVTRKLDDIPYADNATTPTSGGSSEDDIERIRRRYNARPPIPRNSDSESDPEFEAFIAKKWGTPQMNFNRKYLKNVSSDSSDGTRSERKSIIDDKISVASTSYKKRVSNTLRKSFRTLKSIEVKPFLRKSPEKNSEKL